MLALSTTKTSAVVSAVAEYDPTMVQVEMARSFFVVMKGTYMEKEYAVDVPF